MDSRGAHCALPPHHAPLSGECRLSVPPVARLLLQQLHCAEWPLAVRRMAVLKANGASSAHALHLLPAPPSSQIPIQAELTAAAVEMVLDAVTCAALYVPLPHFLTHGVDTDHITLLVHEQQTAAVADAATS